jgi:hypothetical protein
MRYTAPAARASVSGRAPSLKEPIAGTSDNHRPLSDSTNSIVQPQVTLYITGSDESRQVFECLENAGVDFRAVASRRPKPTAAFGRLRFRGLKGAHRLIEVLRELETVWFAEAYQAMPGLFDVPDPQLMRRMESTRKRWRRDARAVLSSVQGASVPRRRTTGPTTSAPPGSHAVTV